MSPSAQIRLAAVTTLIGVSGEPVTAGATTVSALVNRSVKSVRDGISMRDGKIDFSVAGMTEIEIPFGVNQPLAGDAFVDGFGFRHRVKYVLATDISWVLYCEKSKV